MGGGPCHLSSFQHCLGTLFPSKSSLFIQWWNKWVCIIASLILSILTFWVLISSPKLHSAPSKQGSYIYASVWPTLSLLVPCKQTFHHLWLFFFPLSCSCLAAFPLRNWKKQHILAAVALSPHLREDTQTRKKPKTGLGDRESLLRPLETEYL